MDLIRTRLLKRKLIKECREYSYRQLLDESDVKKLLNLSAENFPVQIVAELIVGCVRVTAVLYEAGGKIRLGFDFFVKDEADSPEWILFENLCDTGDTKELTMLKILDDVVTEHGLSYTECSFGKLEGTKVKVPKK